VTDRITIRRPDDWHVHLRDGEMLSSVALGVRAEDVIVHTDGTHAGQAAFQATVGLMEPIGSDTFVELDIGATTIVARVEPDLPISLGQPVWAELRPSSVHLFARESGDRIVA